MCLSWPIKTLTIPGIITLQSFTYGTFTQIWRLTFGLWSIPLCDSKTVTVKTFISIARVKLVFRTSIVYWSVSLALVTKVTFLIWKIKICTLVYLDYTLNFDIIISAAPRYNYNTYPTATLTSWGVRISVIASLRVITGNS